MSGSSPRASRNRGGRPPAVSVPAAGVVGRLPGPASPGSSSHGRTAATTPRSRSLRPARSPASSSVEKKQPLRATASAIEGGKMSPTPSSGRSPSASARTAALEAEYPILYGQFAGRRNPDIDEGGALEGSPSSKDWSLTIDEAEEDVSDLEEPG